MCTFVTFWVFLNNIRPVNNGNSIYLPDFCLLTPAITTLMRRILKSIQHDERWVPRPMGRNIGMEVNTGSPLSPPLFRYTEDGKEVKKEGSTMCTPFRGPGRVFCEQLLVKCFH